MRKVSIVFAVISTILLFPTVGYSQMTLDWASTYQASASPSNTHMATDGSGNIYVAGNSGTAYLLIKYNSAGVLQWGIEGPPNSANESGGVAGVATDVSGNV